MKPEVVQPASVLRSWLAIASAVAAFACGIVVAHHWATGAALVAHSGTRARVQVEEIEMVELRRMIRQGTSCPSVPAAAEELDWRIDPWGRDLRVICDDARLTVISAGEDGEFGTADDIYADDEFRDQGEEEFEGYSTVVFYGTIEKNPPNEDKITIRDRDSNRDIEIIADEEFVVLRDAGATFLRAVQLRSGDRVVVKAFRDRAGNYVAQTIRLQ